MPMEAAPSWRDGRMTRAGQNLPPLTHSGVSN